MNQAIVPRSVEKVKNKYILYLLLCGVMLYFAVQQLNVFASGVEGVFAIVWLTFALFVIAGNMVGLLFSTSQKTTRHATIEKNKLNKRLRSYNDSQ